MNDAAVIPLHAATAAGHRCRGSVIARDAGGPVVVIGTSSGLKDPASTATALPAPPTIAVDLDALADALRSAYGVRLDDLIMR